ncbi:MAG: hypothetical protein CVU38_17385 [Chloroflexi bacterium HGW-Chloroflexi-1]|nr:MAG: hypothetical protein CVU38_17385 [Chloroflexi bacterium HGW-Chloroflexi-1]
MSTGDDEYSRKRPFVKQSGGIGVQRVDPASDFAKEGSDDSICRLRDHQLAEAILETLAIRLNPTLAAYRQLEQQLLKLTEPERLRGLLRAALRANDVAEFEQALAG